MSFRDTFWELLAVTGSLLGSSECFPDPPDQAKFSASVRRPYEFFFRADFGSRKWNFSRRNGKKDVQKSDIALITSSSVIKVWREAPNIDVKHKIYLSAVHSFFLVTQTYLG